MTSIYVYYIYLRCYGMYRISLPVIQRATRSISIYSNNIVDTMAVDDHGFKAKLWPVLNNNHVGNSIVLSCMLGA